LLGGTCEDQARNLSQDDRAPGQNLDQGLYEYELVLPIARKIRQVSETLIRISWQKKKKLTFYET
jgi:hypothetical protein